MNYISPWIYTTYACNLACPYCYVKQCNKVITPETLEKVSNVFSDLLDTKAMDYVVFRIAGGEPLLCFDTWKDTIGDFQNKYRDSSFISILTNATIVTDEMLGFFVEHRCGFGISLDGLQYSKPYHSGESSAKAVTENIDKIIAVRGKSSLDISTVIDKNSFADCHNLARWIAERDLNWGIYLDHYFCGEVDTAVILDKMREIISILALYKYDFLNKFKFNNLKLSGVYEGCHAGEKLIAIGCDGEIWPCQTLQGEAPAFYLGEEPLIEGLKKHNQYKLGAQYILPEECQNCALKEECHGGCRLHNKEINRNFTCDIMKQVQMLVIKAILKEAKDA